MQNNETVKAASSSSKWVPSLVLLFAILPVTASVYLYATDWRPAATVNHGELIRPARPIADKTLQALDGTPVQFSELHGKWTMLYFGDSVCDKDCMSNLFRMRQTHIAQGKDSDRVQTVFIVADTAAVETLQPRLTDYPQMRVLLADEAAMAGFAADSGIEQKALLQQNSIYLVDPMGNLMMRYASEIDPAGLRKDLVRLLKYSGAG